MKKKEPIFVIQKHDASHLHWDFRLEKDGVLKSWAIPKEPPRIEGVKRLAVQVEDHELSYANFEGTIEEGEYGAGMVTIWDSGSYVLIKEQKDELICELKGRKLKGSYCLIKLKGKKTKGKEWLFFKRKHIVTS